MCLLGDLLMTTVWEEFKYFVGDLKSEESFGTCKTSQTQESPRRTSPTLPQERTDLQRFMKHIPKGLRRH